MAEETVYVAKDWSTNVYVIRANNVDEAKGRLFDEGLCSGDLEKLENVGAAVEESEIVML